MRALAAAAACLALCAGCQTTVIRSAWFDPDFAGPPMRKIVVVGDIGAIPVNRTVEDDMAQKLRNAGVDAIAGYTLALGPDATDAAFANAVTNSGAQGLLLIRLLGVDTRTQITTTMVRGGSGWGRNPWGAGTLQPATRVRQTELATAETKLYDVRTRDVVWAATTQTFNPRTASQELPAFATLVIGELSARGVIAPK